MNKKVETKKTETVENIDVKKIASDIIALANDETATVETVETETETATVETATVENRTFNRFENLYNDLCGCVTKCGLVDTMNAYGLRTTTKPTTTANINDLYIQFHDGSRVLITKKSLKLYTNETTATVFDEIIFDDVNDGSYRKKRATVSKSVETFKRFFEYFLNDCDDHNDNYLPTTAK